MKWMQDPEEKPRGVRETPEAVRDGRAAGGGLRRAWRAWLLEWNLFAPRCDGSGDWELV